MTEARRAAPNDEFVRMYRKGIPTSTIAEIQGVAEATVRYHLQIAARAEPSIRDEHKSALAPRVSRTTETGRRNLADVLAFHQIKGRLPATNGNSPRERALAAWLARRRRQAAQGTLSHTYRDALAAIPGWETTSRRKADDEARWQQRFEEMKSLRTSSSDWPRHQKTEDPHERKLGVWLHTQRMDYRAGRLDPVKEKKLNQFLPGWREGRRPRGGRQKLRDSPASGSV